MIKNIKLKKFRNLNLQTDLDPNINIIIGKNGLGKSNFIDSVYYFSYGKSFKRISDSDSIAFDDTIGFARMETVINNDEQTKLAVTFSRVDDKSYKKLEVNDLATIKRKFNNHLYAVMFSPETLDIIIGSPDLRREDLDDFISGINDEYEHKLRDYKNIVRNRNKVLAAISDGKSTTKELIYWTERLLELGSYILDERVRVLKEFRPVLRENAKQLFDAELGSLDINYESKVTEFDMEGGSKEIFAQKIKSGINKEIGAKRTLYGPHRDDIIFTLNDKNIRIFGSRGQQRLAALIFKLSMWFYLKDKLGTSPVLLLDDIFSELDAANSRKLEHLLQELHTQILVTATEKYYLSEDFYKKGNKIELTD